MCVTGYSKNVPFQAPNLIFLALSPEEKESWINALSSAITRAKNRILDEVRGCCGKGALWQNTGRDSQRRGVCGAPLVHPNSTFSASLKALLSLPPPVLSEVFSAHPLSSFLMLELAGLGSAASHKPFCLGPCSEIVGGVDISQAGHLRDIQVGQSPKESL